VIGPNGAGKTTLFRYDHQAGGTDKGTIRIGETVQFGFTVDQAALSS